MTDPTDKLHHWELALLSDPEYAGTCKRIGRPAIREQMMDRDFDPNDLDWMQHFRSALQAGVFPDIAALVYVGNAFARYIGGAGRRSLDEAFNLKSRQRAGNPSAVLSEKEQRNRYCGEMLEYLKRHPRASQPAAAEYASACLDLQKPDIETMVKYFREWRRGLSAKRILAAKLGKRPGK